VYLSWRINLTRIFPKGIIDFPAYFMHAEQSTSQLREGDELNTMPLDDFTGCRVRQQTQFQFTPSRQIIGAGVCHGVGRRMDDKLIGPLREVLPDTPPSGFQQLWLRPILCARNHARIGVSDLPVSQYLQKVEIGSDGHTPIKWTPERSTNQIVGRIMAVPGRTSPGYSLREQRSRKRSCHQRMKMHVIMRVGMGRSDPLILHFPNLSAKLSLDIFGRY